MSRPSKKTIELRKKIIELGVFKRDSEIYTSFEYLFNYDFQKEDRYSVAYAFCEESMNRADKELFDQMLTIQNEKKTKDPVFGDDMGDDYKRKYELIIKELSQINNSISVFYEILIATALVKTNNTGRITANQSFSHAEISYKTLKQALGETRANELASESMLWVGKMLNQRYVKNTLSIEEQKSILKSLDSGLDTNRVIVERIKRLHLSDDSSLSNRTKIVYAELDLTKPLKELTDYIAQLKNDFENNPQHYKNAYELLGEKHEPFQCDLSNCNVLKESNPKPISGRLADVLFIYDCKKVNEILGADILTKDYITREINRYWQDVKCLLKVDFHSIDEYYQIADEYINHEKYKDYLSGIKTTL